MEEICVLRKRLSEGVSVIEGEESRVVMKFWERGTEGGGI